MHDYFHLYIKVDCPFCADAINLLSAQEREFIVTVMDKCPPFVEEVKRQFNQATVPVILHVGPPSEVPNGSVVLVGGYDQLKEYLDRGGNA